MHPPAAARTPLAARTRARRPLARATGAGLAVVLALTLTACSPDRPDPTDAAAALAAALAEGNLDQAPLADGDRERAEAELTEALAGTGEVDRAVTATAGEVREDGETLTAPVTLEWTWELGEEDLTYRTTTTLTHDGEEWTAPWSRELVHAAIGDGVLAVETVPAERGRILAGDGSPLVTPRPVLRIGVDKANVAAEAVADVATGLAETLGFDDPQAFADRAAAAGPKAFVEAITVRQEDPGDVDLDAVRRLPGVLLVPGELPLAPTREFARPILGTVGPATAEIVEESDGAVRPGDQAGLSGLQRQYDEVLRGRPGTTMLIRRGDGSAAELLSAAPRSGKDVTVTLDARLQTAAEEILAGVEPASAIVALRPSTGEVLAAASGPGGQGLSTATLGAYAPGSTFKVATALALLRAGLTPDSPVECTPTATADGREFSNYPGFPAAELGPTTLRGAIASSCNAALIAERDRVDAQDLTDAAAALGLGVPAALGVPYLAGEVPADASGTEHAAAMIGQGRIQASPLAMATVAASVARGERVAPVLVRDAGGEPPSEPDAADAGGPDAAPLTAAEAEALRSLMRAVVEDGTGSFLADVPGEPVHAKSGTAEYGTSEPPRAHAWMIAFQGDLAVATFVEDGIAGAQTAGPLLEEFLRRAA
ncbi:penicillin-binding transpeptidase domain-containing protein [Georgenia thermotolerans]|uniref:penicillin-binding transpeptidase domain-containing protein n=1 Tax=Georgenia thermotolerans TaxID=527326 RepID=UPI001D020911|nr:penicillin-binding transpeptidase domain-containing protein [Georgenia thermotolerans]